MKKIVGIRFRQIVSMLLSLCMLAGVLPTAAPSAYAGDAVSALSFDFQQEGVPYATAQFMSYDGGNWRYFNANNGVPNAFATAYTQVDKLSTSDDWIAFELDDIAPGVYDVDFEIAKIKSGGTVDIYIIPYSLGGNVLAGCTQDNLLGRVDFYADPLINPATEELNQFTSFGGGKFLLVIKGTGIKNSAVSASYKTNPIWLRILKLVKVGEAPEDTSAPKSASITIADEIDVNETKKIAFTVEMESGRKMYALGENDTIEYIATSAGGRVDIAEDGSITGREVGTVYVKAKLNFKGVELVTPEVELKVNPVKFMSYDFKLRNWETELPDYTYDLAGNWQFYSYPESIWPDCSTVVSKGHVTLNSTGTLFILDSTEKWVALELNVPGSGVYDTSIIYNKYNSGGILDLYLIPAPDVKSEEAVAKALGSAAKLGRVNYYKDPSQLSLQQDLNSVVIPKAGKYLFVTKGTGLSDSYADCAFTAGLEFTLCEDIEIEFDTENDVLEYNTSTQTSHSVTLADGTAVDASEYTVFYSSSNEDAVQIDADGKITAVGIGPACVAMNVTYNGKTYIATKRVEAIDTSDPTEAVITGPSSVYAGLASKEKLEFSVKLESGNTIYKLNDGDSISYDIQPEGAVVIDSDGNVTGAIDGKATVTAVFDIRGKRIESNLIEIDVIGNKSGSSRAIWTDEKREGLQYNRIHDLQVKRTAESYAAAADKYVEKLDDIYDMVVAEGLPRYYTVGKATDPRRFNCKYCGANIADINGAYGWLMDPFNSPWKIQCPGCRRKFPSNDFGSYYKLGLNERGVFDPELAKEKHLEMFGGLHGYGYLKNTEFDDAEKTFGDANWGVDDGFGYIYTYTDANGNPVTEQHNYIAYYLHWTWYDTSVNQNSLLKIIDTLKYAYLYTGEAKYGRAGAIILDRIADFYPDFDWYQWRDFRGDASGYRGAVLDAIWSTDLAPGLTDAYDAFYPIYDDERVIDYLTQKSKQWVMSPKNSAAAIRQNAETRILKEVFEDAKIGNIAGNFGLAQYAVASAALAYNTIPESIEMLDWVMAPGSAKNTGAPANITGGNVLAQLVTEVDRDGMGTEGSPSYNSGWLGSLGNLAELLSGYELYPDVDLYKNPKFLKMFSAQLPVVMARYYTAQIGDSGAYASPGLKTSALSSKRAYIATKDIMYAQTMYMMNGNSAVGLRYDDWVKDPSSLEDEVNEIIKTHGEMDLGSTMQAGYGLTVLRDGEKYPENNTLRDFWIYNGTSTGHGHRDGLNLGFDAYGINMAPDIGYPPATGTDPNRIQWVSATISHNTVTVDEKTQNAIPYRGNPMHFDDAGKVKLMDTARDQAYEQTDIYRRTVVMVEVDDQVSYGVDFFRVKGGDDHLYSFHSQSNEIAEVSGLELKDQPGITYAGYKVGKEVPYGKDPHPDSGLVWTADGLTYPAGYTWLDNVKSDVTPEEQFAVDFKIKDWFNVLKDSARLHLRMTMVNDFPLEEVTVANGYPVDTLGNVNNNIKYVLARNTGKDLDTLFTTVFEPYKNERYLSGMESATVTHSDGSQLTSDDTVKAVKVVHKDGRIDYIVYSTNNEIEYCIDNLFNFKGFIGVATYSDEDKDGVAVSDDLVYTYLNDGEIIADITEAEAAYTGEIVSFTEKLSLENEIVVSFDDEEEVSLDELIGRVIYVENDGVENGAYEIKGASDIGNGNVSLDIGDVTLVRSYLNSSDPNSPFIFNIEPEQKFRIPLSYVGDTAPTLTTNNGIYNATAGKKIDFTISASSDYGRELSYKEVIMPRSASFDAATATFSWTPDKTQLGDHSVAIKVSDGVLSTTYNATITVFRGSGGDESIGGSTDDSNGSTGGSTGGSNGSNSGSIGTDTGSDTGSTGGATDVPVTPGEKFIDLTNHAWAKNAIYALVDAGVVNGTSESTYSPANNIKRADFAIMLVRAFGITEGKTEHFADVDASKYYAEELLLAKANGIVGGIGDNKFNPEGEITRQDMMLMLSRALDAVEYELSEADRAVLADFVDAAEISDYAADAVSRVVRDGIITGANSMINPKVNATRAEVAVMLDRVLNAK